MDFPVILGMDPPEILAYSLESAVFGEELINDPIHQSRRQSFLKKKKAMITVPLEAVMEQVKSFAAPLIENDKYEVDCENT